MNGALQNVLEAAAQWGDLSLAGGRGRVGIRTPRRLELCATHLKNASHIATSTSAARTPVEAVSLDRRRRLQSVDQETRWLWGLRG